ncbi:uncharacterized protein K02A2.6-like [Danaus plexippus]|uniref:uncharacterized protein K02A2.6-like n=1 Tax=Danaus plexippus TaxID=13037 RepID=UPI002AB1FF8A|nr:uncharacterized protein K02A2.6-like [Danaus plexippus]
MRARPLAYALREPVERALQQHVRDGILTPVERSDWATPIVPIVKKDGSIRICADYKITLNKVLEIDRYPLPKVEDLLVRLHGGQRFSKLDLSQAYAQFVLDDSKKYTVINTHRGLFMYNRLVYGLASSPGIFQRRLEELFADLPRVGVFLDDVIITGETKREHMENLHKVFDRLEKYGLRVKKEKCEFFAKSIHYLGHIISEKGVHTCPNKVKAILDTRAPSNVSELRSFIGMVMYYSKFIKNISTLLAPLYRLLKSGEKFVWSRECQDVFGKVKERLTSAEVLAHYSTELPLVVTADASSVGVGAVLAHETTAGERPVAYASRSLTDAERHYSQIDKEALAIVFAIRKFHQYLYGRKFVLRTDHKPLTHILGDKVGIPIMAASRLQRWAVLLSGYNYTIEYVASSKNCADALSRLTICTNKSNPGTEITYSNFVETFLPVTNSEVRKMLSKDPILSRIKYYVESGWPLTCSDEKLKPFFIRKNELYIEGGCLMWGYRMVIPESLRKLVLKQLHSSHMGIIKTKSWARSYVWWPGIDQDVEGQCRACDTCAQEADAPPRASPTPWPYHLQPWSRLHIDFLGPIRGLTFMVMVDSTSKWLEIFEMKSTNATSVIKVLRTTFARFGLPMEVVSDQGPPFSSSEFNSFLVNNGITQSYSPVYHPASNGAAENAVKQCKRAIKKAFRDKVDVDTALQTFLLMYRNTIHSTTGETPAILLQKRKLRTRLDLIRNDVGLKQKVLTVQDKQVKNAGGVEREFSPGDTVWFRRYGGNEKWVKGTIIDKEGSRRLIVDNGNGQFQKRHIDQVRRRTRWSLSSGTGSNVPSKRSAVSATIAGGDEEAVVRGCAVVDESTTDSSIPVVSGTKQSCSPATVNSNNSSESSNARTPQSQQLQLRPKRTQRPVLRYGFEPD